MGKSRLSNGLIIPPTHLELIVVDHCNITCRYCNHASPIMPSWYADPDTVHRDFSVLAKYYRPSFVKVLGGEPLMHRHLDAVIGAARATGISDHFTLTTNGALIHKATDAVWQAVDEVEISLYPGVDKAMENVLLAKKKAESFGKKLTVCNYDQFRATFGLQGTSDANLVNKIYAACKIANVWGCHAVRDGFFYKCPQSIYIPIMTGLSADANRMSIIDGASFPSDLLEFINSPEPLAACAYCVGTVGKQETSTLLPRGSWHDHIDEKLEELIDYDWLERSLITQDTYDDCKIPSQVKTPRIFSRHPWLHNVLKFFSPITGNRWSIRRKNRPVRQTAEEARRMYDTKGGE
jgi:hypothetical protein